MSRVLPSYVKDAWVAPDAPEGSDATVVRDASTGGQVCRVSSAGIDLPGALAYARDVGQRSLGELTFHQRALLLKQFALALSEHKEELYELSAAAGSTRRDAMIDVDGGIGVLFTYSSKGRRELPNAQLVVDGPVEPLSKDGSFSGQHVFTRLPGVAVQINAFNFPMWGPLEKLAPAFLAGMPSIIKPATPTAYITEAWVRILVESGLVPAGSVQLVCGAIPGLLERLRLGDLVGFTGSASTAARAAHEVPRDVRFTAETDSINASVLGLDAEPGTSAFDAYVRQLFTELTAKAGQKCTAIRRAVVPEGRVDAVVTALRAMIDSRVVIGDPRSEGVTMGPLVSLEQRDEVLRNVRRLQDAGGDLLLGSLDAPAGRGSRRRVRRPVADRIRRRIHPRSARGRGVRPRLDCAHVPHGSRGRRHRRPGRRVAGDVARHRRSGVGGILRRRLRRIQRPHPGAELPERPYLHRPRLPGAAPRSRRAPVVPAAGRSSAASARCCTTCSAPRSRARRRCSPRSPASGTRAPRPTRRGIRSASRSPSCASAIASPADRARSRSPTSSTSPSSPATPSTRTWTRKPQPRTRSSPDGSRTDTCSCPSQPACSSTPAPGPVLANYGLENLRFLTPVSPGDSIRVTLTAKQITPRETDEYGEVRWDAVLHNQRDETVATYDVLTLVAKE